jgi:hypothetical protein
MTDRGLLAKLSQRTPISLGAKVGDIVHSAPIYGEVSSGGGAIFAVEILAVVEG